MKKNTIAVCDSEAGYAGTLAEYLNNRKKLPFRAEAFTDPEKFCQYAGINHPEFLHPLPMSANNPNNIPNN